MGKKKLSGHDRLILKLRAQRKLERQKQQAIQEGTTLLIDASIKGITKLVKTLLSEPNKLTNDEINEAFWEAYTHNQDEILAVFLNSKLDINSIIADCIVRKCDSDDILLTFSNKMRSLMSREEVKKIAISTLFAISKPGSSINLDLIRPLLQLIESLSTPAEAILCANKLLITELECDNGNIKSPTTNKLVLELIAAGAGYCIGLSYELHKKYPYVDNPGMEQHKVIVPISENAANGIGYIENANTEEIERKLVSIEKELFEILRSLDERDQDIILPALHLIDKFRGLYSVVVREINPKLEDFISNFDSFKYIVKFHSGETKTKLKPVIKSLEELSKDLSKFLYAKITDFENELQEQIDSLEEQKANVLPAKSTLEQQFIQLGVDSPCVPHNLSTPTQLTKDMNE